MIGIVLIEIIENVDQPREMSIMIIEVALHRINIIKALLRLMMIVVLILNDGLLLVMMIGH